MILGIKWNHYTSKINVIPNLESGIKLSLFKLSNQTFNFQIKLSCIFECTTAKFHRMTCKLLFGKQESAVEIKESYQDPYMIDSSRPLISSFYTTLFH